MTFEATYLGSNGWLIKFEKTNLIIDPWLTGDLIFPPGEWFFKGSLKNEIIIEEDINIILLTQGLADHCHIPSLNKFKTLKFTRLGPKFQDPTNLLPFLPESFSASFK